jgi:prevent-host-death family protein
MKNMKVAPMGEVRNNFAKYLAVSEQGPVFVTRNGRITAVIEHIEDADIEDFLLERSPLFRRMLEGVKREKGGMTLAEYRKSRSV